MIQALCRSDAQPSLVPNTLQEVAQWLSAATKLVPKPRKPCSQVNLLPYHPAASVVLLPFDWADPPEPCIALKSTFQRSEPRRRDTDCNKNKHTMLPHADTQQIPASLCWFAGGLVSAGETALPRRFYFYHASCSSPFWGSLLKIPASEPSLSCKAWRWGTAAARQENQVGCGVLSCFPHQAPELFMFG